MFKECKDNIIKYCQTPKAQQKTLTPPPELFYMDESWLYQAMSVFRSLPIIKKNNKVSPSGIIDKLKSTSNISTINGDISTEEVRSMLEIVYKVKRSQFVKGMTKSPLLGTLTPVPMYALKEERGISYNDWDREDPFIAVFLGTQLNKVLEYQDLDFNISGQQKLRDLLCTSNTGAIKPFTAYPLKTGMIGDRKIPARDVVISCMYAQLWLANSTIRRSEAMILNWQDWEDVPEALDANIMSDLDNLNI